MIIASYIHHYDAKPFHVKQNTAKTPLYNRELK